MQLNIYSMKVLLKKTVIKIIFCNFPANFAQENAPMDNPSLEDFMPQLFNNQISVNYYKKLGMDIRSDSR